MASRAFWQAVLRLLVAWLVLLSLENVVAFACATPNLRVATWASNQLYGIPLALAILVPLAAIVIALGRLVESRRGRLLGLIVACVAIGFAIGLSRGPHLSPLVRRVPFVAAIGIAAFYLARGLVWALRRAPPGWIIGCCALAAAVAWVIDQRVLLGLYPSLHIALECATLVAVAGVVRIWPARLRSLAPLYGLGAIAMWAAVALVQLQHDDDMRQALLEDRPILGRVMLSVMQARTAIDGGWKIDADDDDPEVATYLDTTSCTQALDWNGCDVLLVTIDALRADHVGAYGYQRAVTPNIDRLAAQGTRFEHAYTSVPTTAYALPSIMAGRNLRSLIASGGRMPAMWPAYLRDLGYQTFSAYAREIQDRVVELRGAGFEHVVLDGDSHAAGDALASYLSRTRADRPVFAWIHALEPHAPYSMHPELGVAGGGAIDAYDSEIAYVDAFVGRAVDAMQTRHRCTVTIVTADHGEAFGEHGAVYHGTNVYEEQVRVPLIVVGPGVRTSVSSPPVETIDLLPTVLSALGRPRPEAVAGHDLGGMLIGRPSATDGLAFAENGRFTMVAAGNDRFICDREARACSLYDLSADPGEREPINSKPARAQTLGNLTAALAAMR